MNQATDATGDVITPARHRHDTGAAPASDVVERPGPRRNDIGPHWKTNSDSDNLGGMDMEQIDIDRMKEAITWASHCDPMKPSIPKVGAIIAIGNETIGRGRRGTGIEGDDDHAESNAIKNVTDKSRLPEATLYTTLEPCTRAVRSKELECCTELILQHRIKKVFIGILDPNQGVTGKGLWELQSGGVEVELFSHELAQRIRAINSEFIRSQQTLGVRIISPQDGDTLRTYETDGRHSIRFECLNPPSSNNYLLSFGGGECWPQPGPFREMGDRIWEIDAHFGATGHYILHIVTATELGQALVEYYRKIISSNTQRRDRLKSKLSEDDMRLLGGDYVGIRMHRLPKGLHSEASLTVTIAERPVG
jgi:pyrimidine deaminase RibD-like protein